jgi:hypothetical protein
MSKQYKKNTSRFSFGISRNLTAKKAGSNNLTIQTLPVDGQQYATGTTQINMTIKEARALQSFLNHRLVTGDSPIV